MLALVPAAAHATNPCDSADPPASCYEVHTETQNLTLTVGRPSGTVTSSPAAINCGSTCQATVQATRDCDYYECSDWSYPSFTLSASGGPPGYLPSWSGCDSVNGSRQCLITVNANRSVSLTWLDSVPPTVGLSVPNKVGAGGVATASGSDNSGAWTYTWFVDETQQATSGSTLPIGSYSEGSHVVKVRAQDYSGNQSGFASATVLVDKSTSLTAGTLPAFTNAATVTLTFGPDADVPNDPAHRACALNGGTFGGCGGATTYSPVGASTPDGTYTYGIRVTDDVGNVATLSRSFVLDRTSPALAFTAGPAEGETVTTGTVSLGFSVTEANLDHVSCAVDAGTPAACTSDTTETVDGLADGAHTITVSGIDKAGNEGHITRSVTVARPSPPSGGDTTGGGTTTTTGGGTTTTTGDGTTASPGTVTGGGATGGSSTPPRVMHPRAGFSFKRRAGRTLLTRLTVDHIPAGGTLTISCAGRGCPKHVLVFRNRRAVTTTALARYALRPGARVTLLVTRAGFTPRTFVLTIRRGRGPVLA